MPLPARLRHLLPALALVVAVIALYAQTARHAFVDYDTSLYVTTNPRVLTGLSWDNAVWAFTRVYAANWHPLTWLSHQLDVELFGLAPAGHNLVSAAWHAANALLAFALFQRLSLARPWAFAAALFFAIHPLRVESVAWVVERKDQLSVFFGLASLLAWLSFVRARSAWKLAGSLALFACSLMAKPMFVTLPCLLLVLDFWPLGRTSWRPGRDDVAKLPFLVLAAVHSLVTVLAQASLGAVQGLGDFGIGGRVSNAIVSYAWYVGKTLWPSALTFHYPLERGGPPAGEVLLALALLLLVSFGAWRARRAAPWLLAGWLWYLGTLVPVIGFLQAGAQAHADRFTYLPGLGLELMLFPSLACWLAPRVPARALAAVGLGLALGLGAATWRQIGWWRDTETLARRALEVTRDNNVAYDQLGIHLVENGRLDEGLGYLRRAVEIAPTDPDALGNLGAALLRKGEHAEAERVLRSLIRLAPWRAQAWSHLGGLYYTLHRNQEALEALDEAVRLDPHHVGAWSNRGLALEALGRLDEARTSLERALDVRPDLTSSRLTLARLLLRSDRPEEARAHFERVLAEEPQSFEALRGLERVEIARRDWARAYALVERALALRPQSAPALADKAWILASAPAGELARPKEALELAGRAVAAGGEQPALLDALALASAASGDFARAVQHAEKALELVRASDAVFARRVERRLAAYRAGQVDRETPR